MVIADRVDEILDRALGASDADATEALYMGEDSALTRFANNQIHQNVREHDASLQVRVIDADRIGVASTNRLDDAGIREVVERATAIAGRSAPNPKAAVMPEPDGRQHDPDLGFVAATAEAGADCPGGRRARRDRRWRSEATRDVRFVLHVREHPGGGEQPRHPGSPSGHQRRAPDGDDGWIRVRCRVRVRPRRRN